MIVVVAVATTAATTAAATIAAATTAADTATAVVVADAVFFFRYSIAKGWKLVDLALKSFPPTSEFENYFELFLRNKGHIATRAVQSLHEVKWNGEKKIPKIEELGFLL